MAPATIFPRPRPREIEQEQTGSGPASLTAFDVPTQNYHVLDFSQTRNEQCTR